MLELLSPAGSPEAAQAAVQNGADAIYLGLDQFNARRHAKNFTEETLAKTIEYCHIRGCKVYVTLNTLLTDREVVLAQRQAKTISRLGADAIIVQDLGLMGVIRDVLPEMHLHASTQMGIHNLEGVKKAQEFGAKRVILARELSLAHIAYIAKQTDVELEVFAHGALCMCYSGQCYMSALIGGRSGNRGSCAQPCRLPFGLDGTQGAHLSLKDLCLAKHILTLEACGVTSLKIEGRMKRPEYVAVVTQIYSDLIRQEREPSPEEMQQLVEAFSRQGFTDGYFTKEIGPEMLGTRQEENKKEPAFFAEARKGYQNMERARVPLTFYAMVEAGKPAKLAAKDALGNTVKTEGMIPQKALNRELTKEQLETQISKTGGTPYYLEAVQTVLDPGLNLPAAELNRMRREVLDLLSIERGRRPQRSEKIFHGVEETPVRELPPQLNVSLLKVSQLTDEFIDLAPTLVYLPIDEILDYSKVLAPYLERPHLTFSAVLPRVILDDEKEGLKKKLAQVQELGIKETLVSHMGHIDFVRRQGLEVRGDFGLHVFNGHALEKLKTLELKSATVSFECNMAQIRDMPKPLDLELIAYGRLPLMVTEHCIVHNVKGACACDTAVQLKDRRGASFPVIKEGNCKNTILNSRKLFLADRAQDYMDIGLWGVRLCFTTENARECREVLERYLGISTYEPGEFTRGLYYRGVE